MESPLGSDLPKALPLPRAVVKFRLGQASPPSIMQPFTLGSRHLPGHFEAAQHYHTRQKCSQPLFLGRGSPPPEAPALSISLKYFSVPFLPGSFHWKRNVRFACQFACRGEGARDAEASRSLTNSHPVVSHRLALTSS